MVTLDRIAIISSPLRAANSANLCMRCVRALSVGAGEYGGGPPGKKAASMGVRQEESHSETLVQFI